MGGPEGGDAVGETRVNRDRPGALSTSWAWTVHAIRNGNTEADSWTGSGLDATQQEDASVNTRLSLATALLCCAAVAPLAAGADPREVRREVREGAYEIDRERHEAAHEIRRCETRECAKRESREGKREVKRERHEAHHEIQAARGQTYWPQAQYARNTPYYYYNNSRYYGDNRYYGHNAWDRVSHFHPNGHYCRDVRHVVHYRDGYYRNSGRWYRDGRYWNEPAYVDRYYRQRHRDHDDDDNDDLVRGIVIGAAVVGVIAAVHEAND